ncbi:DUF106 domain-containing protein [Halosegnis marinus]|uniref:DUF106 domain-containing protein n=1 Tax=Halosegnis marinus TaxID=3034023 RepID=A0ABD5ZLH5_9EURY|nr:DUF106 domain-containing protein [Halosegnis sp. DT85]
MARTAEKVEDLVREDPSLRDSLEFLLERDGAVTWGEASGELSSGQWGRLIEKGILADAGEGFELADPEGVREGLSSDGDADVEEIDDDSSWSTYDKLAGLGALGMFAGYSIGPVRNAIGGTLDVVLGPIDAALPFYGVILVLATVTGLYSTLLQANLMDTEKMGKYQQRMKDMQERRKAAQERGDDEELDRIQEEQMEAMGDNLGMFKEQFRPMVWIMLLTIPVFLWMYWMILSPEQAVTPQTVTLPLIGTREWTAGVLGPLQAWILWYFLCSMSFNQLLRKSLNIQTTPSAS